MVSGKVFSQNRYEISSTVNHKAFTADHVRLTCSKNSRNLASKGEFLQTNERCEIGLKCHKSSATRPGFLI